MNLLPVQEAALEAARHRKGFAWFMDMGLGKTLCALAEFEDLVKHKHASRMLVICPNSFKGGWAAEAYKHRKNFAVHVYASTRHRSADRWLDHAFTMPPMLVMNYEALLSEKTRKLIVDYTEGRRVYLVVDESIMIKGNQSKRTKFLHKLNPRFAYRRILTGKPTTQGAHDLWAQLHLINAAGGMNFYSFRNRFCIMGGWENRQVIGVKNTDDLRELMQGHIFEAKKKDWLAGLPDKSYVMREYALTGKVAAHYAEMEEVFLTWLAEQNEQVTAEIAITKYGKLSQIHCGFIHDNDGAPSWLVEDGENPRLKLLLELLDDIDSKVCVVYRHKFVGEQLQRVLRDWMPALISGGMKPEQVEAEKHTFNTDPACRIMLLQCDASKYGHTLIGTPTDPCHTMVFYENTYSLDTRSQIEDRIHRQGQARGCLYVDLVGTEMDTRVVRALQRKERVFQALFGAAPLAA